MRLSPVVSSLSILSIVVILLISCYPKMLQAEAFSVTEKGKTYHCNAEGGRVSASKQVKGRLTAYSVLTTSLRARIKRARGPALVRLRQSLKLLLAEARTALNVCIRAASNRPTPSPTATPTPEPIADNVSLAPYAGPADRETVRLLLERAAYGLSKREENIVSIAAQQGLRAAIDEMMRVKAEEPWLADHEWDRVDGTLGNVGTQNNPTMTVSGLQQADLAFAVNTNNPFYSNFQHFFFGLWTVGLEVLSQAQYKVWWDYWKNVLLKSAYEPNLVARAIEMGRHPMMLIYLSNATNLKGNVNENFARELQELFTMGTERVDRNTNTVAPNYVEYRGEGSRIDGDIYRIAQAFTGWRVSALPDGAGVTQWRSVYSAADHEEGTRMIYEGTAWAFPATNDESVVRGIFANHPAPRDFIATQLLKWFLTPEPPLALVRRLGDVIHQNNYNLVEPLKILFNSVAFYHPMYRDTLPKTSHQVMVEFARTLGLYRTAQVAANLEGGLSISRFTGNSGQSANLARIGYQVTNPPDVFFFRDSQWLAPPTLIETVNAHFEIISGDTTAQQRISWTPTEFLPQGDLYAREVADSVGKRFGCNLTSSQLDQIVFFMNHRRTNVNGSFTRLLYDNTITSHQNDKGRPLAGMIASQPCFLLK